MTRVCQLMDSRSDADPNLFGSLDFNTITWESGGKTVINDDDKKPRWL